jgi:hypothetical protein
LRCDLIEVWGVAQVVESIDEVIGLLKPVRGRDML